MSIKKLLEKVAVGATVGALVIVGAAGIVLAQKSPYVTGTPAPENAALDVKAGSAELPILFNVDLRAVLYALPNLGPDGFTFGLDTISQAGLIAPTDAGNMANVGWLFAETNYSAWDILVARENGGFLVRDPKVGETAETIGGLKDITCTNIPGPFGSSTEECDTVIVGGKLGIALKYTDGTTTGDCPLALAVGVIDRTLLVPPSANAPIPVISVIEDEGSVDFAGPLLFKLTTAAATDPENDYASIAYSLAAATGLPSVASGYFVDNSSGTPVAVDWDDVLDNTAPLKMGLFPQINNGPVLRLDREIGDPYNPEPSKLDQSIVFFINARLDTGTGGRLTGNRNGVYSENLIFTFYGLY